jgi:hypothetical protein
MMSRVRGASIRGQLRPGDRTLGVGVRSCDRPAPHSGRSWSALPTSRPEWGPYLKARYTLTQELASQTHDAATDQTPGWARGLPDLDTTLVDDIRLWRAAHTIPDTDLRPTGPIRWATAERRSQRDLADRLEIAEASIREWTPRIVELVPSLAGDPRTPILATKPASLDQNGYDADRILQRSAQKGPLPDDHSADALGYRITHVAKHPRHQR